MVLNIHSGAFVYLNSAIYDDIYIEISNHDPQFDDSKPFVLVMSLDSRQKTDNIYLKRITLAIMIIIPSSATQEARNWNEITYRQKEEIKNRFESHKVISYLNSI